MVNSFSCLPTFSLAMGSVTVYSPSGGNPGDRAGIIRVNHDAMLKGFRFHGDAQDRATFHFIADFYFGCVFPLLLAADRVKTASRD